MYYIHILKWLKIKAIKQIVFLPVTGVEKTNRKHVSIYLQCFSSFVNGISLFWEIVKYNWQKRKTNRKTVYFRVVVQNENMFSVPKIG
jgi:hypothetical protein